MRQPHRGLDSRAQAATHARRILLGQHVLLLIALILLGTYFTSRLDFFLTSQNVLTILRFSAVTFIVATGFTLVLIGGGLDLSIGSGMAVVGVTAGKLFQAGVPLVLAFVIGVVVGTAIGFVNGFIVTRFRINPLIATLAMLFALLGVAFIITDGRSAQIRDDGFRFARENVGGVPVPVFFLIAVAALSVVLLHTTSSPPLPAKSGIAGVLLASDLGAIAPNSARNWELYVATAVFLGGASLTGGRGSVVGTFIGVVFVSALDNGLVQMAVRPQIVLIVVGAAMILAVAFDQRPKGGFR